MDILIQQKEENDSAWIFGVDVDGMKYLVGLPREYWKTLTDEKVPPDELVRKSFEFLLEREPKESILSKFELPMIQKYFPEYESEIQK